MTKRTEPLLPLAPIAIAIVLAFHPTCAQAAAVEPPADELAARIARVEAGLPAIRVDETAELSLTLEEWMEALDVPGLGIAVIDDHRLAWAKGYGVTERGGDHPVTAATLFQAASISKPLTALAVLHHVESGTFDLDTPINEYLRSWKLPDDAYDASGVTLRRLLAHTAGITPGGFEGYPVGEEIPSLVQVLEGKAPAKNAAAEVVFEPGTAVRYSGIGYTMLQLALIDRLDASFPEIMNDAVIGPLGLESSSFELDLPRPLAERRASGHDVNGNVLEGGWRIHPELAAAGLWATPSDLAAVAIEVARSRAGKSKAILSATMTRTMLTREKDEMALGWVVGKNDEHGYFAHSGGNVGFRCHMRMLADSGKGLVIMTNSDNGSHLLHPIIESVAREFEWPSYEERQVPRNVVMRIRGHVLGERTVIDPAILAAYAGRYELAPGMVFDVAIGDGHLEVQLGDQPRFPVFPESETRFYYEVVNAQLEFVRDEEGGVTSLILHQNGRQQVARRIE